MPQFKDAWKKSIFHFEKRSKFASVQLNITPLIDVIFLLLIFFMLTSTFVSQAGIKVNLPRAVSGKVMLDDRLIIIIDKEDRLYINDKKVVLQEIKPMLIEAAANKKPLLITCNLILQEFPLEAIIAPCITHATQTVLKCMVYPTC